MFWSKPRTSRQQYRAKHRKSSARRRNVKRISGLTGKRVRKIRKKHTKYKLNW